MSKRIIEEIICPICNKKYKQLEQHIIYSHNMTVDEFKIIYPDSPLIGKVTIIKDDCEYICDECGIKLNSKAGLTNHRKRKHGIENPNKKVRKRGIKCEICGYECQNLSQHLKVKHNVDFQDYKIEYNYNGPKSYFSEDHKKNLSINKKKFYDETERGKELKEKASILYSGDGNPAKRKDVREKISKSAIERFVNNDNESFEKYSYGLRVWFEYNLNKYFCRSFEEFMIIFSLLENNIKFEYENHIFKYKDVDGIMKNYLLDLYLPDNNEYYEIKAYSAVKIEEEIINSEKYSHIIESLSKLGKELKIVNKSTFLKNVGLKNNNKYYFYSKLKKLIETDNANVSMVVFGSEYNGKILNNISDDYKNDKNIKLVLTKEKI